MPVLVRETAYLEQLVSRLRAALGPDLLGVYAGGSWALGGYEKGRSDLDVSAVTRAAVSRKRLERVAERVAHERLPCPARKLELVVYPLAAVVVPTVEPGFLLNLNTGAGAGTHVDYEPVAGERHWFAIDRSVLAGHGVALCGPPAAETFVPPTHGELLRLLADTLRWHLREAPDDEDGALNAARALHFARNGMWLAKPAVRDATKRELAACGSGADVLRRAAEELDRLAAGRQHVSR